jgi:ABC-type glycerol-3-phosphate transport system substrate-binding protein
MSQGEGAQRVFGGHMLLNSMHGSHWFWGNGAEIIDAQGNVRVNEPVAIETLEYGLEYYKQMWSPAPTDIQSVPLVQMFITGRVGMLEFSQSSVPTIAKGAKFDWGVMPTSIGKGQKAHAVQFTDFWYVHGKSANPEDSYRAIEVLNREEFETAMAQAKTGGVPTLKGVADKFGKELLQNDAQVSLASLDRSREPYYAVNHLEWQKVVNTNMELLWLGKVSAKECAENIVKAAAPVLAADKGA